MPSLTDIPEDIRENPNKTTFLSWLKALPITFNHKRSLATLWSNNTNRYLDANDWTHIKNNALPETNHNGTKIPPPTTS